MLSLTKFRSFAQLFLGYNVAVMVWGAFVRATGSGAGCGSHWPTCNGVILPRSVGMETWIEFAHRLSSGLTLVGAFALFLWARKLFAPRSPARRASLGVLVFTLGEAAVGAIIVLYRWVAHDQSLARVISISLHLTNTLLLLACLALTWHFASAEPRASWRWDRRRKNWVTGALLGGCVVGAAGAVTALGDTLFASTSLREGMAQDFSASAHWMLRLRVFHPLLAMGYGAFLFGFSSQISETTDDRTRLPQALIATVLLQWALGGLNLLWMAPIPLQLLHLAVADGLWVLTVLGCARLLTPSPRP